MRDRVYGGLRLQDFSAVSRLRSYASAVSTVALGMVVLLQGKASFVAHRAKGLGTLAVTRPVQSIGLLSGLAERI